MCIPGSPQYALSPLICYLCSGVLAEGSGDPLSLLASCIPNQEVPRAGYCFFCCPPNLGGPERQILASLICIPKLGGPKGWSCFPVFCVWYSKEHSSSPPTSPKFHPPPGELSPVPLLLPMLSLQSRGIQNRTPVSATWGLLLPSCGVPSPYLQLQIQRGISCHLGPRSGLRATPSS